MHFWSWKIVGQCVFSATSVSCWITHSRRFLRHGPSSLAAVLLTTLQHWRVPIYIVTWRIANVRAMKCHIHTYPTFQKSPYRSLCKRDQYFCNQQYLSLIALSFSSEWLDPLILQRFKVQRYGIPKCVTEIKNMLSLFSLIEPPEIVCTYICIPSILQLHMATPRPAIFILRVGVVYPCSLCHI